MLRTRLLNLFIAIALLIVAALTVQEALATASIVSKTNMTTSECASLPSRYSLHVESQAGTPLMYTEDGPAGVDGGLIQLLSNYRACSR